MMTTNPLTVAALIAALAKLPPDAQIVTVHYSDHYQADENSFQFGVTDEWERDAEPNRPTLFIVERYWGDVEQLGRPLDFQERVNSESN